MSAERAAAPVSLERERRLRALDARLMALLEQDEHLAARTLAMLDGETMTVRKGSVPTSVVLSDELRQRLEALAPVLEQHPDIRQALELAGSGRGVTQSMVLRLAIAEGAAALERRYSPGDEQG